MRGICGLFLLSVLGALAWSLVITLPGQRNPLGVVSTPSGIAVLHDQGLDIWDGTTWTTGLDLGLQGAVSAGVASVGDVAYVVGITYPTGAVWPKYKASLENLQFQPSTGESEEITWPIYQRAFPAVASIGTKVYKFAGMDATGYGTVQSEYLETTDLTWHPIANFPENSYGHITVAAGARIYFFGGRTVNGAVNNQCRSYDPALNTYAVLTRIPTIKYRTQQLYKAMIGRAAIVLADGRIALWGGYPTSSVTDIYDPGTNTWGVGPSQAQDGSTCFGVAGATQAVGRILSGEVHSVLSIH